MALIYGTGGAAWKDLVVSLYLMYVAEELVYDNWSLGTTGLLINITDYFSLYTIIFHMFLN